MLVRAVTIPCVKYGSDVRSVLQNLDDPPKLSHRRFIHVYPWYAPPPHRIDDYLTLSAALVAVRVFALHNGRSWVRKFLWLSGTLYFLSTIIIVTLGTIPVFRMSAIASTTIVAHRSQRDSPALPRGMCWHCRFIYMCAVPLLTRGVDAMVALDYMAA